MIRIVCSNIEDLDLSKCYGLVSDGRKAKIDRYRFEKDKKLSCGVELILLKLLNDLNITDPIFKTGKYGKPYLSNHPEIYFNMSHSENYIACGVSDLNLGVDIEYNDSGIDLKIAKNYFYNTEYESIINAQKPSDEFFNYWVLKESYMKYTGLGFRLALDSFEITKESVIGNDELKLSLFDVDDYKLGITSRYKVKKIEEIDINSSY